jgi:hypothetical protein
MGGAGQSSVTFTVTPMMVTSPETDFILASVVSNDQLVDSMQSSVITVNP